MWLSLRDSPNFLLPAVVEVMPGFPQAGFWCGMALGLLPSPFLPRIRVLLLGMAVEVATWAAPVNGVN